MNDVEIESLLSEAGYQYSVADGGYQTAGVEESELFGSEEIADQLEIPLEDLVRWEEEQRQADSTGPG